MSKKPYCVTQSQEDLTAAAAFLTKAAQFTPTQLLGLQRYHEISQRVGGVGVPEFVDRFRKARAKGEPYEEAARELADLCHILGSLDGAIVPSCEEYLVRNLWRKGATDAFDFNMGIFYTIYELRRTGISPPGTVVFTEVASELFDPSEAGGRVVDILVYALPPNANLATLRPDNLQRYIVKVEVKWYNPKTRFNNSHNIREMGNDLKEALLHPEGFRYLRLALPASYDNFPSVEKGLMDAFAAEFIPACLNDEAYLRPLVGLPAGTNIIQANGNPHPLVEAFFEAKEQELINWFNGGMLMLIPDELP